MNNNEWEQQPKSLLPRDLEARFVSEIKARRSVDEAAAACGVPEDIAWQAAHQAANGGRLIHLEYVRKPRGRHELVSERSKPDRELRALLFELT